MQSSSSAFSSSLTIVSTVTGWSILSGMVMLLSLAALRIIRSASATRLLAYSHKTDSGNSLRVNTLGDLIKDQT